MIFNPERVQRWQQWKNAHIAGEAPDPARAFALAEALYREAKCAGTR
jgi:hypothetical protein